MPLTRETAQAPRVFAYGSLVGRRSRTPGLEVARASIVGWMRTWSHGIVTPRGRVCALSIAPSVSTTIQGLALTCDDGTLREMDEREIGYSRVQVPAHTWVESGVPLETPCWVYIGGAAHRVASQQEYPIWLSYLITVLVGYMELGGPLGLEEFFRTTVGWETPILDDRDNPKYSRAVHLSAEEDEDIQRFLSDHSLGANFYKPRG